MASRIVMRGLAAVSRRLDRPEIMAVIDAGVRNGLRDDIAGRALFAALLKSTSTYIDIGTNRGQWLETVCRVASDGRHLAFEPIPELRDEIAARFPHVDLRDAALSSESGRGRFCRYQGNMDGWSGLRRRPGIATASEWIDVRLARLDDEIGALAPSLIKIDVEGGEVDVLQGARSTLAAHRPTIVFEHQIDAAMLYERTSEDLWTLLASLDYRIFELQGAGPFGREQFARGAGERRVVNWLGVPE